MKYSERRKDAAGRHLCTGTDEIRSCDCNHHKTSCHCSDCDCEWEPEPIHCDCDRIAALCPKCKEGDVAWNGYKAICLSCPWMGDPWDTLMDDGNGGYRDLTPQEMRGGIIGG